jgi:hypothetical protein
MKPCAIWCAVTPPPYFSKTSPPDSTQPRAPLAEGSLHENAAHFMIAGLGAGVPAYDQLEAHRVYQRLISCRASD